MIKYSENMKKVRTKLRPKITERISTKTQKHVMQRQEMKCAASCIMHHAHNEDDIKQRKTT